VFRFVWENRKALEVDDGYTEVQFVRASTASVGYFSYSMKRSAVCAGSATLCCEMKAVLSSSGRRECQQRSPSRSMPVARWSSMNTAASNTTSRILSTTRRDGSAESNIFGAPVISMPPTIRAIASPRHRQRA
jgi:hypothetical protein